MSHHVFLLSLDMFIRRKPNRSGTYSVQVISKHNGRYVLEKSFGASSDELQLKVLEEKASCWMSKYEGQTIIDFTERQRLDDNRLIVEGVLDNIDKVLLNGPLLILDGIYDSIGFGLIEDSILRHLAISPVCQPMSKLATVSYLKSHFNEHVALHDIYRYMDKLHDTQREQIQQISVEHTRKILGGCIGIVFYDVTTLYFETAKEDTLRCPGFSKDGKTSESQVVLGLLVSMAIHCHIHCSTVHSSKDALCCLL